VLSVLLPPVISCSGSEPDAPGPTLVKPGEGVNTSPSPITIYGTGFNPLVRVDYDDKQHSTVSTAFSAHLGPHRLQQVTYLDETRLAALVPAGLPPGSYSLTVIDPRGRRGALDDAFAVQRGFSDGGPDSPEIGPDATADAATDGPRADQLSGDLPKGDLVGPSETAPGPVVATFAGTGTPGFNNGVAASAQFHNPRGIAIAGASLYVGDFSNHRIRQISAGQVTTLAGSGSQGLVNGAVASARFNYPVGVAADSAGSVYVGDSANDVIRMIKGGAVTTLAGSGTKGFLDGSAASARFNYPKGLAEAGGIVYVADSENHRIRRIQGGVVSTLAGSGTSGFLDGPAASARFSSPSSVAISGSTIYVVDTGNNRIRSVVGGAVTTVAGTGAQGNTDGAALTVARFWNPVDLAVSGATIYVADQANHRVRVIKGGVVSTLCGSYLGFKDGPLSSALFYYPSGLALGGGGTLLYVADQSNHRIRVISF